MGFKKGARATCWTVQPISDTMTKVNLSTQCKSRDDGFEKDFSDYVTFVGTANAKKALSLKEKDHIVLGDCEVKYTYGDDKRPKYRNFIVYSFDMAEANKRSGGISGDSGRQKKTEEHVDYNPVEDDSKLPF